jgi:hypothetical protein
MTLLIAFLALVVDGGLNLRDKRDLQAVSDIGALAGAAATGVLGSGPGQPCAVLQVAESYAWQNLVPGHIPAIANCAGPNSSNEYTWTEPGSPYTVTATYPYANQLPSHAQDDPNVSVHVVIQHTQNTAFARAFGVNTVAIQAQSAAKAGSGNKVFPFALATRFLDITGSASVGVFGATLIGNCDDEGRGDYSDNSHNGGLFGNGGADLVLGTAKDDVGGLYTSAQALLLAKPPAACAGGQASGSVAYSGMGPSNVCFDVNSCQSEYNGVFGFNSGPTGCAGAVISPATPSCQAAAAGDGLWQDPTCWGGGSGAIPIKTTAAIFYSSTGTTVPSSVTGTACINGATREGSFLDATYPGFPHYPSPESTVAANFTPAVGTTCSSACVLNSTPPANHVYTSVAGNDKTNFTFAPGWYVLDGQSASIVLKGGSITCTGTVPANGIPGCVFVFRRGASLDMQGSTLNCSPDALVANTLPCSFSFADTSVPTSSYMSLTGTDTYITPIGYTQGGVATNFPVFWSASRNNPIQGANSGAAALQFAGNTSKFEVKGTIYANRGSVIYKSNAAPVAGQTIADIVELQGGSGSTGSAAYSGNVLAPIPGAAVLFE